MEYDLNNFNPIYHNYSYQNAYRIVNKHYIRPHQLNDKSNDNF